MASLYSTQFFAGNATGTQNLFTVPSGHIYVLRDISLQISASGATVTLLIASPVAGIFKATSTATNEYHEWQGRHVILAGQTVQAAVTSSGCYVLASGYDLTA